MSFVQSRLSCAAAEMRCAAADVATAAMLAQVALQRDPVLPLRQATAVLDVLHALDLVQLLGQPRRRLGETRGALGSDGHEESLLVRTYPWDGTSFSAVAERAFRRN